MPGEDSPGGGGVKVQMVGIVGVEVSPRLKRHSGGGAVRVAAARLEASGARSESVGCRYGFLASQL